MNSNSTSVAISSAGITGALVTLLAAVFAHYNVPLSDQVVSALSTLIFAGLHLSVKFNIGRNEAKLIQAVAAPLILNTTVTPAKVADVSADVNSKGL